MKNLDALLFLSYLNLSFTLKEDLVNHFGLNNINEIFNIDGKYLKSLEFIGKKSVEKILEYRNKFYGDKYIEYLEKSKVKFTSILDDDYPKNLFDIPFKPLVLYYRGNILPEDEISISIVGSRKCTPYGNWATEYFSRELSNLGINIVSGMALGIDSISHKNALKTGNRTIAILGSSVDVPYPKTNYKLYEEIIENGAVISEFPLGTPPTPYNFPIRNRIIAGISKALLVIEAQEKSGTLITAKYANEQSKDIFAVPGNINSIYSKGTNLLIRDGALIATSVDDIISGVKDFSDFLLDKKKSEKIQMELSELEEKIYSIIKEKPTSNNELSEILNISIVEINSNLTMLELKDVVTELNGGIFTIK